MLIVGVVAMLAMAGLVYHSERLFATGLTRPMTSHRQKNALRRTQQQTRLQTRIPTLVRLFHCQVKNLKVAFTSQAPLANWDHAHEEACEEASALMVDAFWHNRSLSEKAVNDAELVKIEKLGSRKIWIL